MPRARRRWSSMFGPIARRVLLRALGSRSRGRLVLRLPDGSARVLGDGSSEPAAELCVHDDHFFARALLGGEIAIGEAYMDGLWSSPDLVALLEWGAANRGALDLDRRGLASLGRLPHRRLHRRSKNDRSGSRSNIAAHYDLSNEFFALFLDETMTYSSAVFESADQSLADAQRNKYELLARRAGIRAGDRVLEIGTGWGGFAIHAADNLGCHVTTVTISEAQAGAARHRVAEAALSDRVDVQLRDYRDITGAYDAIVSIEMLEAVGAEYFETYFEGCARALRPGGRFALQTISVPDRNFEAVRTGVNWIQRYIFPGGMLPSLAAIERALTDTPLIITHVEDIAPHYAETLRRWRSQFHEQIDGVRALGFDARFIRTWDYYLALSEAGFRTRRTGDLQIVLEHAA